MMKKALSCLILLTAFQLVFSQKEFESGYFIDNSGAKVECLIESENWTFSPEKVFYKLTENSQVSSFTTDDCQEFRIGDYGAFKRVNLQSLTEERSESFDSDFSTKTGFAQKIVQGKASLFRFSDRNGIIFLYRKENGPIQPLEYDKHTLDNQRIKENTTYKSQLIKDFECGNIPMVQEIQYTKKSLIKYFEVLNKCLGDNNYITFEEAPKQKQDFPITLKAWIGIQRNTFELGSPESVNSYPDENLLKYGLELEFFPTFFGFKNLSVVFLANYHESKNEFNSVSQGDISVTETFLKADYQILAAEAGLRYYINISPKSTLFIDAGLAFNPYSNVSLNQTTTVTILERTPTTARDQQSSSLDNDTGGFIGFGYSYNKRLYLRLNWRSTQDILNPNIPSFPNDEISGKSVSLGYSFW